MFEKQVSDVETLLYNGYTKFTKLSTSLKFYNIKVDNEWSGKNFIDLLSLLKDMLLENIVFACHEL